MRRLAWWGVGVGLFFRLLWGGIYILADDSGSPWTVGAAALDSIGYTLFMGGAILLGASVVADAITKAAASLKQVE